MIFAGMGLEPGKKIHFVGIGGSGMLGLAEWSLLEQLQVSGSDRETSAGAQRLEALGARIDYHHNGTAAADAHLVVHSTAIRDDNPELKLARGHGIPVLSRGQLLGELSRHRQTIAVCGSHGKSTTTALLGHCLREHWPAHVYLGARAHNFGSSFHYGDSRRLIAEVDESDGTFLDVRNDLSVLTGLSNDHEAHYGSREKLYDAFEQFLKQSSVLTKPIVCGSDPEIRQFVKNRQLDVMSYGFDPSCDISASNVLFRGPVSHFSVSLSKKVQTARPSAFDSPRGPVDVALPMLGHHNILNALSVFAAALQLGVPWESVVSAMRAFAGVERRMERMCSRGLVSVFSDYAHNPQKIAAIIETIQRAFGAGQVLCLFEPHRYTRLKSMWDDFIATLQSADNLRVLPIYDAGEAPITGISRQSLIEAINRGFNSDRSQSRGRKLAGGADPTEADFSGILQEVLQNTRNNEPCAVIFLGAGSSHKWARMFVSQLEKAYEEKQGIPES